MAFPGLSASQQTSHALPVQGFGVNHIAHLSCLKQTESTGSILDSCQAAELG